MAAHWVSARLDLPNPRELVRVDATWHLQPYQGGYASPGSARVRVLQSCLALTSDPCDGPLRAGRLSVAVSHGHQDFVWNRQSGKGEVVGGLWRGTGSHVWRWLHFTLPVGSARPPATDPLDRLSAAVLKAAPRDWGMEGAGGGRAKPRASARPAPSYGTCPAPAISQGSVSVSSGSYGRSASASRSISPAPTFSTACATIGGILTQT